MKTKKRIIVFILLGWSVVHGILYLNSNGYYSRNYFWPFAQESNFYSQYNFDEFFAYALVPWISILFYKLLYPYFKI